MANVSANASDINPIVPPVTWAQRREKLIVIIEVENCQSPTVKFSDDNLFFRGTGGPDKKTYEISMELNGSIAPEESTYNVHGRNVACLLKKTEACASYWPRLLKSPKKMHFLKTNFELWRDEDDSEEERDVDSLDSDFSKLMGEDAEDKAPTPDTETDSDDEDLPDLK